MDVHLLKETHFQFQFQHGVDQPVFMIISMCAPAPLQPALSSPCPLSAIEKYLIIPKPK